MVSPLKVTLTGASSKTVTLTYRLSNSDTDGTTSETSDVGGIASGTVTLIVLPLKQ